MREYLDQVRRVAETDLYYVTLQSALVIPDMCAGLEAENGRSTPELYRAWFDEHVADKYVVNGKRSLRARTVGDCDARCCTRVIYGPTKGRTSECCSLSRMVRGSPTRTSWEMP